jgi:hypothetical protein
LILCRPSPSSSLILHTHHKTKTISTQVHIPMVVRAVIEGMNIDDEEEEIDDESGEGDDMGDSGDDDDVEEGDDAENDEDSSGSDDVVIEDEINVEQFTRTFHNGDYDQEFDNELISDRAAPLFNSRATQASYNKPDDWRERNRIGLESVRGQLQECIDSLSLDLSDRVYLQLKRNGSWGQQIIMDNEEPIVWHEPILDENWNNLDAEIDRRKQKELITAISSIHIENVEIKMERIAALVAMFLSGRATNSSTQVIFDNANISGEGIVCLSKLVDVSSELQYFCLTHNRIDNMESARCLSRALKSHTVINHLDLAHCDLGSSPEVLSVILQSDVSNIRLNSNNIDSSGAVKIAEYLEGNPHMHSIHLDHNHLNDDDAMFISQALKRNTNLKTLSLHTNNYTSIGVKALLTCVFDGSCLNAISESNHTLETMQMLFRDDIFHSHNFNLAGCIDRLLQLNCAQKIMLALQDKDSLLQYLSNVPLELIPEVLEFPRGRIVNEHVDKHLNIVYSTMRWWNMPLLYSYYNCVKSDTKRKREMTV